MKLTKGQIVYHAHVHVHLRPPDRDDVEGVVVDELRVAFAGEHRFKLVEAKSGMIRAASAYYNAAGLLQELGATPEEARANLIRKYEVKVEEAKEALARATRRLQVAKGGV